MGKIENNTFFTLPFSVSLHINDVLPNPSLLLANRVARLKVDIFNFVALKKIFL